MGTGQCFIAGALLALCCTALPAAERDFEKAFAEDRSLLIAPSAAGEASAELALPPVPEKKGFTPVLFFNARARHTSPAGWNHLTALELNGRKVRFVGPAGKYRLLFRGDHLLYRDSRSPEPRRLELWQGNRLLTFFAQDGIERMTPLLLSAGSEGYDYYLNCGDLLRAEGPNTLKVSYFLKKGALKNDPPLLIKNLNVLYIPDAELRQVQLPQGSAVVPGAAAAPGTLPGTLLHYDFREFLTDGVLADRSGCGHHGRMKGAFAPARHGEEQGLRFNGKDTVIAPDECEDLKVSGAFSLALRFRITPEEAAAMKGRAPLIFGATDNRGALRNCTLFFDYGTTLVLNVGNGVGNESVFVRDAADGQVHTVAYLADPPHLRVYRDGQCIMRRDDFTMAPDRNVGGKEVLLGNWRHGVFRGELYDLRLFDRMLNPAEVLKLSGAGEGAPAVLTLTAKHSDFRGMAEWRVGCEHLPEAARRLELELDDKPAVRRAVTEEERRRGLLAVRDEVTTAALTPGRHRITALLYDAEGRELLRKSCGFEKRPVDTPEKFSNTIGITDEVLPPWTPIELDRRGETVSVSVWNRRYDFAAAPLAVAFRSGGPLSAGNSALVLEVDGRPGSWTVRPLEVVKNTPAQAVLRQSAQSDAVEVAALHTVDYDGFDRILVTVTARRDCRLTRLAFRCPLHPEVCKAAIRTLNEVDDLSEARQYPFLPMVQIGDEFRGLHYMADSNEFWFPKNNPRAITVSANRNASEVLFSLNPVAEPAAMKAGERFTYEFALTATPIRPMTPGAWQNRYANIMPYCGEFTCMTEQYRGRSVWEHFASSGMRGFIVWRTGEAFGYPPVPGTDYADKVAALARAAHDRKLKIFPYCIGFLFSELAPEWNEERLYRMVPYRDQADRGDFLEKETGRRQHAYIVCNSRFYQDLMLYRLREAILKLDIDGVYLDGTADVKQCSEALHGCGYTGRDGLRKTTYCGFQTRDMIRRIHTLIYQLKGDAGVVDLHFSDAYHAPAAAWATSLWGGEQLPADPYAFKALPPARFRFSYTGRNIGVAHELLCYTIRAPFRAATALAMVHGTSARPQGWQSIALQQEFWKRRDALGCEQAEFIGYWYENCPVKAREEGVFVSCYRRSDGSLIAAAANLTEKAQTVHLTSAVPGVRLPEPFELDSQDFRLIDLKPGR